MAKMSYAEQLKHPNWQRKRLEILQRDEFMCQTCYDKESTLHVHHRRYVKGRKAWEYEGSELVTLCDECHQDAHARNDRLSFIYALTRTDGPFCESEANGLLAGWLARGTEEAFDIEEHDSEHLFVIGEIAAELTLHFHVSADSLRELRDAIARVPYGEMTEAIQIIVKALNR